MEIIEYNPKYVEDVKDLLTELEEYIVSIDEDHLDQVGENYHEEMIKYVCMETWETLQFNVGGFEINLDCKWPRYKYADLLKEIYLEELKSTYVYNYVFENAVLTVGDEEKEE